MTVNAQSPANGVDYRWKLDTKYGPKLVPELRKLCKERGVSSRGNKSALVDRLNESDAGIAKGDNETTHPHPGGGLKTFKYFMQLPHELRDMIYDLILLQKDPNDSRVLDVTDEREIRSALPGMQSTSTPRLTENDSNGNAEDNTDQFVLHPIHVVALPHAVMGIGEKYYDPPLIPFPRLPYRKNLIQHMYRLLHVSRSVSTEALPRINMIVATAFEIRIFAENPGPCGDVQGWWDRQEAHVLQLRPVADSTSEIGIGNADRNGTPKELIIAPFRIKDLRRIIIYLTSPMSHEWRDISDWAPSMAAQLENLVRLVLLPSNLLYLKVCMVGILPRNSFNGGSGDWEVYDEHVRNILKPLEVLRGLKEVDILGNSFYLVPFSCSVIFERPKPSEEYQAHLKTLLTSAKPQTGKALEMKLQVQKPTLTEGNPTPVVEEAPTDSTTLPEEVSAYSAPVGEEAPSIFGGSEANERV